MQDSEKQIAVKNALLWKMANQLEIWGESNHWMIARAKKLSGGQPPSCSLQKDCSCDIYEPGIDFECLFCSHSIELHYV